MTRQDFNTLPIDRRSDMVWEWGNFIATEKREKKNYVLFALDGIFIEVQFSMGDQSRSIVALPADEIFGKFGHLISKTNPFAALLLQPVQSR